MEKVDNEEAKSYLEVRLTRNAKDVLEHYRDIYGNKIEVPGDWISSRVGCGDFLIFLGNYKFDIVFETISNISHKYVNRSDILEIFKLIAEECSKKYGPVISRFLVLDSFKSTYDLYAKKKAIDEVIVPILGKNWRCYEKDAISENSSIIELFTFFLQCQLGLTYSQARIFLNLLSGEKAYRVHFGDTMFNTSAQFFDVYYEVASAVKENELCFFEFYTFNNSSSYVLFDFMDCVRNNVSVKKCENCNKYFIPKSRSSEIYCENNFRNGKTCRQVGYENKMNKDEVLKAYRTAYKTQNAKKLRNRHIADIDERFKKWHKKAKNKLLEVQEGKMTVDEFKAWLKTDWIQDYVQKAGD